MIYRDAMFRTIRRRDAERSNRPRFDGFRCCRSRRVAAIVTIDRGEPSCAESRGPAKSNVTTDRRQKSAAQNRDDRRRL